MKMKCCFCGEELDGWGNNPWPVDKSEHARCCDACNSSKVIPARIKLLKELEDNERKMP